MKEVIGESVVGGTARQIQAAEKEKGTRRNIRNWRIRRN